MLAIQDGLGFRVGHLARSLRRAWARELAPLGLSPPQAAVLRAVTGEPGCSLRALARTLGADPMNVKHCVDDLEGRGLIQSGDHPADRRLRTLTATEGGSALSAEVDALAGVQHERLNGALSPAQRRGLDASLRRLEAFLESATDTPIPWDDKVGPSGSHRRPRRPRPNRVTVAGTPKGQQ
ncbi:MAG: MarR family winged helix-turn-helix transcriptional regulator [Acidimicrobiales bacterium]